MFAELEREHLLSRTCSDRDRRQFVLDITTQGRDALARDMAERDRWLAAAIAELTETEIQVLRIAGTLRDRIADSVPACVLDRSSSTAQEQS